MEDCKAVKEEDSVHWIVFESTLARMERINRRLATLLAAALLLTGAAWAVVISSLL